MITASEQRCIAKWKNGRSFPPNAAKEVGNSVGRYPPCSKLRQAPTVGRICRMRPHLPDATAMRLVQGAVAFARLSSYCKVSNYFTVR